MLKRAAIWLGGAALLAATLIDTLAVICRHIGWPITGSIEAMQAVVLVAGSLGLVIATWEDSHARVGLVVERLSAGARRVADWLSEVATLAFVVALLIGSIWLAADLWPGHEQSELLGVPWAVLRAIANISLGAVALLLVLRLAGSRKS